MGDQMPRCETCKWWVELQISHPGIGNCYRIMSETTPVHVPPCWDCGPIDCDEQTLQTPADFGCTLHERKESE